MANIKFSAFTTETNSADVDFLVGYQGTTMKKIAPSNLGSVTSLNDLSDVLIDGTSAYFINIPSGLVGNPVDNLVIGSNAGNSLTDGTENILIGKDAGDSLTTGDDNIMIGVDAGQQSTTAVRNIMIGNLVGATANTSAGSAVSIGYQSSQNLRQGIIAIGYQANTVGTGQYSTALGYQAGRVNNATGTISIGYQAGYSNTSGTENTNLGYQAGYTNTTGSRNVTLGYEAGYNNVGSDGVLIGYQAGYLAASSLNRNTMVGAYAGRDVGSTRFSNTFIGYQSGRYYNSNLNCFVGSGTGRGDSGGASGSLNTAIGGACFENSTTASRFIAIGYQTLKNGTNTGNRITAIGCDIHVSDSLTGSDNVIIGSSGSLSAVGVSNEVNLYNGSVVARFQGAASAWSFVSDERDKKDIEDLELGLDFVNKLKPRKFKWDIRGKEENKNKEASGFIAQEVKQTLEEVGASYTGIVDDNNPEQLTLAQANIIPMLVKSIQELKAEIELLKQ